MIKYPKKNDYELYDMVINNFTFFYSIKTGTSFQPKTLKNFNKKFTFKKNNFKIERCSVSKDNKLGNKNLFFNIVDFTKFIYTIFKINDKLKSLYFLEFPEIINKSPFKPDFNDNIFYINVSQDNKFIEITVNNERIKFYFNNLNDLNNKLNIVLFYCFSFDYKFNVDHQEFRYLNIKIGEIINY